MRVLILLCVLLAVSISVGGAPVGIAAPANNTAIKDIEGVERKPLLAGKAAAAVVFFLSHDCPISNGYSPEVNRICKEFGDGGKVVFHIVHPYVELTADEARKHAKEFGYTVPVIVDHDRAVTKAVGAKVTPQAVVLSPDGKVLYSGRIDDTWTDFGKRRPEPTVRDLRNALTAVLAGKPVPTPATDAIGCPIE